MPPKLSRALLRRAVRALRDQAQFEAGCSQAPDLVAKEDTQAWIDAKVLDACLRNLPPGDIECSDIHIDSRDDAEEPE